MGKKILRMLFALLVAGASYVIGVALWFLSYKWEVFTQFVANFNHEVAITLILPALFAGGLLHALWPRGKKS